MDCMMPARSDEEGSRGIGSNDCEGRADSANINGYSGDSHAAHAHALLPINDSTHTMCSAGSTCCVVMEDREEESNFSTSASPELRKCWEQYPTLSSGSSDQLSCQRNINGYYGILEDSSDESSACENDCGNIRVRAPAEARRTVGKTTGPDEPPSPPSPQPLTQHGHVEQPEEQDVENRDPFPVLSPMPSISKSMSSSCANEDRCLSSDGFCRDSSSLKTNQGEEYYVVLNDTKSEGSNAIRRFPPSVQTPMRQRPALLGSNHEKTNWLDPFPTPDISRCSTPRTPTSQGRVVAHDSIDRTEWNRLLLALPKFPLEDPVGGEPSSKIGQGRSSANGKASSYSQLTRCASAQLSLRKVVSENSIRHKSASFDRLWDALENYGPDGNELENDTAIDWRFRDRSRGKLPSKMLKRRNGIDDNGQNESWDDGAIFPRSSSAPNGLRQRTIPTMAKTSRSEDLSSEIKPAQSRQLTSPLTPTRLDFHPRMKANRDASSLTAPLSPGLFSPVRQRGAQISEHAKTLYRKTSQRLKERKERRRQRRLARQKQPRRSWWIVIPADHPYKIAWDALTMLWALLGAYRTHTRIRDRVFDQSPLILLTEIWFTLDVFLNFVTEHKTRKGELIVDGKAVWARYLTTWFLIDVLSLIPWERIYVRPVVEKIKRRNIFQKTFFRSKAVVRVSRILRGRHVKLFGQVSRRTGTPLHKLVQLVIKYLPKYLVFLRNMKGALLVRGLRFVHWLHNMYKKIAVKARTKAFGARRKLASRHGGLYGHPIFQLQSNEETKDKRAVEEDDTYSCESDESAYLDGDNDDDNNDDDEKDSLEGDQSENHLQGFQNSDSPTPFVPRSRSFSGADAY